MQLISKTDHRPYMNVWFGNFYSPAYDNETFVDETMRQIKALGFNSVMFDTKAWKDFRERCETGALSQYVKMQEYMGESAHKHGLAYNFLVLYLNGDNLYPHIRFSPPIYGEEIVTANGRPGKWYKYWSEQAQRSMKEHVERIMERYGDGCERCAARQNGKEHEVIPICSMWDPVAAPSFDDEGIRRYTDFLESFYHGNIKKLNQNYGTKASCFSELKPEEYWHTLRYGTNTLFTEEDVEQLTSRFLIWRDNALWKMQELVLYFAAMQTALKEKNPNLFLCPDMTQWGYFLNIYGRTQVDQDNDFSDLWDTAMRGIDIYALAPYVDACHFITVPTTPDGYPDAYVVSCQHSMMRVMNEGRTMIGGIYWGRFIYYDLYAQITPGEVLGTMAACGMDGYSCYGINGLDDGGVLDRMDQDFLDDLKAGNTWCAEILSLEKGTRIKEIALLFPSEMALFEPYEVGNNKIRRLDLLGWYKICCDLGYQVDVISEHEIKKGALADYSILIVPANDCYAAVDHTVMEAKIRAWVQAGGILLHGPKDALAKSCFGIDGETCAKMPYCYGKTIIPQGESFCKYHGGEPVSEYVDGFGHCVVRYSGADLSKWNVESQAEEWKGLVYAFGVQIGASYAAKNIPHVPYEQSNREMYPLIQSKTTLIKDILYGVQKPASGICGRGIETGVFEAGMVIVNHRSTPYTLPRRFQTERYLYPNVRTEDGRGILEGHRAVWVSDSK